jgi:hypothetical protein
MLARNARSTRADKYTEIHSFDAWSAAYIKRRGPTDSTDDAPPTDTEAPSNPTPADDDPDAELHNFLDNRDPTIHLDYIPKPGEQRYFQRGHWRWY